MDLAPVAHEKGEVGLHRDAGQDDAAMGVAVGQHLGHQHMGACQVLGGPTTLSQAAMRHLQPHLLVPRLVASDVINDDAAVITKCKKTGSCL